MKTLESNKTTTQVQAKTEKERPFFAPSFIQPKLTINEPGDKYEQEADAMADRVMRMSAPTVQRKCTACEEEEKVQRQEMEEEEPIQAMPLMRKAEGGGYTASPQLSSQLSSSKGVGSPLPGQTLASMNQAFGADFSSVRIHAGSQAAEMSQGIQAKAFTHGSDIYFNQGQYSPESSEGRRLLGHELTHTLQQGATSTRVQRKPKARVELGEPTFGPEPQSEEWSPLEVQASGMDHAAQMLATAGLTIHRRSQFVFVGLNPKFMKVYGSDGKPLGGELRFKEKEAKDLHLVPGVYVVNSQGSMRALFIASDNQRITVEGEPSVVSQRPLTDEEKAAAEAEELRAAAEGRAPKAPPMQVVHFDNLLVDPEVFKAQIAKVSGAMVLIFVPTYRRRSGAKGSGEPRGLYASPLESRGDGKSANAPPWPVDIEGPRLVPVDADPTYKAKVNWSANGNFSIASQVISQVGTSIHYRWELFDITEYAKKEMAKDPAGTKDAPANTPEKTLDERIEEFKKSQVGTGTDVTGMGGANREFKREFEYWWKDTKRAAKGTHKPGGDTLGERLSNAAANRLSLELAPVALLTTALGSVLRWVAELFAGPRKQQEIPLEKQGIFLVRVITTPAISEDRDGNEVVRPPSVAARVTEVTPMERAVREGLDEPGAQLAELEAQIAMAEQTGNTARAEYLRNLLAQAQEQFEGLPITLLMKKRAEKQRELDEYRKNYPSLSTYSREQEIAMLDDQIGLYLHHEQKRTAGASSSDKMKRLNATLISEVTGEQYPLLLSAGPMAMEDGQHRWMLSDVSSRDGDYFIGRGDTKSAALHSALTKFGEDAAYGRGRIGIRTAGLQLEANAPAEMIVDSAPANWALAEKRIDDLLLTLAALGLIVASAGTASALIGGAVAAARLIKRWQAGKLYLDAQTVSDLMGVLGGLGAGLQLAGGLRVQRFEKAFAITQEGRATEQQIAGAARALEGAQQLVKVVELANEALNYAGLVWGNVAFLDQMMAINEQEAKGEITHAAARRARASAISSAVQNNGLFIAGNVLKAKQAAAKETKPTGSQEPAITDKTAAKEPGPAEKLPTAPEETTEPGESAKPRSLKPKAVPIGERRATPAELRAALPPDLHRMLVLDHSLEGDTVQVKYEPNRKSGLIERIRVHCSPDARPGTVTLHVDTVRTMQKYQGFSGRVRQALHWVADLIGFNTLSPEKNPASFEAALEIRKLPKLIQEQLDRMQRMEPAARDLAEAELESLRVQLDKHLRTLDLGGGEAAGLIAGKGLSRANQKKYAELLEKLRGFEPGTDSHKKLRWEMYQLVGGDLPYTTWEKVYAANVERAKKANASVVAEQKRLGWGNTEQTVPTGRNEVRRLDIADIEAKKGVEVKTYETGRIFASEDIVFEVQRDAKLVKRGWDITWVMVDTEPSSPLLDILLKAGIKVELRTRRVGNGNTKLLTRYLPAAKATPRTAR